MKKIALIINWADGIIDEGLSVIGKNISKNFGVGLNKFNTNITYFSSATLRSLQTCQFIEKGRVGDDSVVPNTNIFCYNVVSNSDSWVPVKRIQETYGIKGNYCITGVNGKHNGDSILDPMYFFKEINHVLNWEEINEKITFEDIIDYSFNNKEIPDLLSNKNSTANQWLSKLINFMPEGVSIWVTNKWLIKPLISSLVDNSCNEELYALCGFAVVYDTETGQTKINIVKA